MGIDIDNESDMWLTITRVTENSCVAFQESKNRDKRTNSDKFEQHGSDHGRVSSLTVTIMFSLIRRISYGVIPRPDRPWEGDGMFFFFHFFILSYTS